MAKAGSIRGLQVFISDIRACQNREQETKRVDKELAKIRKKFSSDKTALSAYDRKKYVWKLLYIYMLGYDVEFGHKQACDLIPAQKYSEKQVGYTACSILLTERDEFLRLSINAIHNDLTSRNESFQCLALTFVANIAGQEMSEALTPDVVKLLTRGAARPVVRKKAALCLLRLVRKSPADQLLISSDTFSPVVGELLDERDLGLLLAASSLLLGILARSGAGGYEQCQPRLLRILDRCTRMTDVTPDYTYYGIASPWLQVKVLRCLQYFPAPSAAAPQKAMHDLLAGLMTACGEGGRTPNVNKANAQHAILFELLALCLALDSNRDLLAASVGTLGRFLTVKEPNIRYLALEHLARLALVPEVVVAVRDHQHTVVAQLKDADVSVRRRALDLLFTMCDGGDAPAVVEELLKYLTVADFSMREELVLKVAILAEKFAPSVQWYVDVVLSLLERAGDFSSEDIWHRVVQLVTNTPAMQQYAASAVVALLQRGVGHDAAVAAAASLLGDFGKLVQDTTPALEQYRLLASRFHAASPPVKGQLLTAFLKVLVSCPGDARLAEEVNAMFDRCSHVLDAELQQRAVEYQALARDPVAAATHYVLPLPQWEGRESTLLRRLQANEGADADNEALAAAAATSGGGGGSVLDAVGGGAGSAGGAGGAGADALGLGVAGGASRGASSDAAAGPVDPSAGGATPAAPAAAAAAAQPPLVDLLGDDFIGGPPPAAAAAASASGGGDGGLAPAAAAPAAVTAPPPDPLEGLVGGGQPAPSSLGAGGGAPAPAPAPVAAAAAAAAAVGAAYAAGAAGAAQAGPFEENRVSGDLGQWLRALQLKDKGVLYEDTYMQVGVKSSFQAASGQLLLFLGNKHATAPLEGVALAVDAPPGLQAAVAAAPPTLLPKQQIQVPVQLQCLAPFTEAPTLRLAYTAPGGGGGGGGFSQQQQQQRVAQALPLPVGVHKFLVPEPGISREAFFEAWKAVPGPPAKQQEMVQRAGGPISAEAVRALLGGLQWSVAPGMLDPNPHNEAGAALFACGSAGAEPQRTLCQYRVEANPVNRLQFRVTVAAAGQPALALALKDTLAAHIRSAEAG